MKDAMILAARLLTQAQALAAVAAKLQLEDQSGGDPELRRHLDRVVDALGATEILADLTPRERAVVAGFARSYLRQAVEMVEDPVRPGAWTHTDAPLLQAQGRASEAVATLLAEAGLGRPGARILDVGTGVARLAIALTETFPDSTVVGLDPWEPALELARANVAEAGLESRITLVPTAVDAYDDADGFDLTWLPTFFIPEKMLDDALAGIRRLTRPGGVVVVGPSPHQRTRSRPPWTTSSPFVRGGRR